MSNTTIFPARTHMLFAMRALLAYYKEEGNANVLGRKVSQFCPLCRVVKRLHLADEALLDRHYVPPSFCDSCPWVIFEGKTCYEYNGEHPEFSEDEEGCPVDVSTPSQLKEDLNGPWVEKRIEMLTEWISRYQVQEDELGESEALPPTPGTSEDEDDDDDLEPLVTYVCRNCAPGTICRVEDREDSHPPCDCPYELEPDWNVE